MIVTSVLGGHERVFNVALAATAAKCAHCGVDIHVQTPNDTPRERWAENVCSHCYERATRTVTVTQAGQSYVLIGPYCEVCMKQVDLINDLYDLVLAVEMTDAYSPIHPGCRPQLDAVRNEFW